MKIKGLITVVLLFFFIVFFAGCGRKTDPVFTGKGSAGITGKCNGNSEPGF